MYRSTAPKVKDKAISWSQNSTTMSERDTRTTFSGYDSSIPDLSGKPHDKVVHQPLPFPVEPILAILQTDRRNYSQAFDYRTYRLDHIKGVWGN